MFHWRKNGGPEPHGDLLKMDVVCTLEGKTRSPDRPPSPLSKPQFNLGALLLCYKMNNCLWVHSQAHDCFYITSKNLRRGKDIALSIFRRNLTFPSSLESMLSACFEDGSQSLTEDLEFGFRNGEIRHWNWGPFSVPICQTPMEP